MKINNIGWNKLLPCLIVFISLIIYINGLNAFFVGDDYDYFRILGKTKKITDSFTISFWGEWEPLVYFTYMIDYWVWKYQPLGYHIFNILVNSLSCLFIYLLVKNVSRGNIVAAFLSALFFAVHPAHDEAILYIAARGHVLSGLFFILSLYCFERSYHHRWYLYLSGTFIFTLLGVASKETCILIPLFCIIISLLYNQANHKFFRSVLMGFLRTLPSMVAVLTLLFVRKTYIHLSGDKLNGVITFLKTGSIEEIISTKHLMYLSYYTLIGFIPYPFANMSYYQIENYFVSGWLLFGLLSVGLIPAIWITLKHSSWMGKLYILGYLLFILTILPTMSAELSLRRRYLFLPSMGISMIVGFLIWRSAALLNNWRSVKVIFIASMILFYALISGITIFRNQLYTGSGHVASTAIKTFKEIINENSSSRVILVTLPTYYGGDYLAGAYLFHSSDIKNCLNYFVKNSLRVDYLFKTNCGDDFQSKVTIYRNQSIIYKVKYRHQDNYYHDLLKKKKVNRIKLPVKLQIVSFDDDNLSIQIRITKIDNKENKYILVGYSDGKFYRIPVD